MASISPICKKFKFKNLISALKSPTYRDFIIKKLLKSKTSKSHTWAPLMKVLDINLTKLDVGLVSFDVKICLGEVVCCVF
jgi:hypothetical protein